MKRERFLFIVDIKSKIFHVCFEFELKEKYSKFLGNFLPCCVRPKQQHSTLRFIAKEST